MGVARLRVCVGQVAAARRTRLDLEDGVFELRGRFDLQLIGPFTTDQLVEHDAERVHIASGGQRQADELLGAGVTRGQCAAGLTGQLGLGHRVAFGFEQLGDAEVEQAHLALRGDQDVGGFEIAVDHQVGMCMLHRQQHLAKQRDALAHTQALRVAPARQGLAIDVFERQPGLPVARHTGVVEAGDVGVAQRREDVALAVEADREGLAPGPRVRQLDGDPALQRTVVALGQPDFGHAALAQRTHQAVGPDGFARSPVDAELGVGGRQLGQAAEEVVGLQMRPRIEHAPQLRQQRVGLAFELRQPCRQCVRRQGVGLFVQGRQGRPLLSGRLVHRRGC